MTTTEAIVTGTPGRRTGAMWVAATGAFLLLAAAAVFVAARWEEIPEGVKLAVLVGLTGAAVLVGDRVRKTLPATGSALFHLGALLIPVDGAALGLNMGLEWQTLLLADSLLAVGALTFLAWRSNSVVLAAAASGAVVATAAGIGAVTAVPAALVLAVFAVGATWYKPTERHSWVWAQVAGLAPLLWLALSNVVYGRGVAEDIGVLVVTPWYASIAAGVLSAFVIAKAARTRNEPALAIVGLAALFAHGIAAWSAVSASHTVDMLMIPSLFVAVEVAVLLAQRDSFWRGPALVVGNVVEALAALATAVALPAGLLILGIDTDTDGVLAIACAITGIGWLAAAARRDARSELAVFAAAIWGLTAVSVATLDPRAVVMAAVAAAAAFVLVRRSNALPGVCGLAVYAALAGMTDERVAIFAGVSGLLLVTLALTQYKGASEVRSLAVALGAAVLGIGLAASGGSISLAIGAVMWIAGCWLLALAADLDGQRAGDAARVFAFFALFPVMSGSATETLAAAVALTAFAAIEGVATKRMILVNAAVLPLVIAQAAATQLAELNPGEGGLALCVAAAVWLGISMLTPEPWAKSLMLAALGSASVGIVASATTPETFGPALLIVGLLALGQGVLMGRNEPVHLGALAATVGTWVTLAANDVVANEAYAVPVALYLLGAGIVARRDSKHPVNSWIAYGPAVALLAGAALAERFGGGDPWHSIVAGAVGVVAVIVGGSRRLAAPLFLGTAVLIAVVARESLDAAAGVPTWAWLAAGGATLIGAAVAMERNDVGPIEAGKRVVDVVAAHFG